MSTERDAGLQALQQGNPAAAVPLLETAVQQNPSDFDVLLFLGEAYGQVGRQMDAIRSITSAVQLQPANAQARYNLAVAMEQGGYRDQAIQALGQALTLQPSYPKAEEALRRLQGSESSSGAAVLPASDGSQAAPGYGPPSVAPSPYQAGYGQTTESSAPPQAGFGRVAETPVGGPQPAANPYAPTSNANLYGQPPANPYAPPPATQGPYPYVTRPMGGPGAMSQVFNPEYAGFGARIAAWLIDTVLMTIVGLMVGFVIGFAVAVPMAASGASQASIQTTIQPFSSIAGILINWLYFALFESSAKQATLGKQALGLKVTDLDGNRIGFGRASGRFFGKIISGCLLLVGYFMAAFTEKKQALHDMMAGTLVVKR